MIRKILTVPNPVLTTVCAEVMPNDPQIMGIIQDLTDTLLAQTDPEGVGIAAPQIGKLIRIFIIRTESDKIIPFINPVITNFSKETYFEKVPKDKGILEGCLSIPQIYGKVTRSYQISVSWTNSDGQSQTQDFKGLEATYIQHEFDHLNGILFTQHCLEEGNPLFRDTKGKFEEIRL